MNPYRKVNPGEALQIAAATWNRVIDEVATRPGFDGGTSGNRPINFQVRCKNATSGVVPRWGVLQITGVLETPTGTTGATGITGTGNAAFESYPGVVGVTPTTGAGARFVVAVDPIPAGAIGMAAIDGVVQVKLDIKDQAHNFATTKAGSAEEMQTASSGDAAVLWKSSATGTNQWGLVRVGAGAAASATEAFKVGKITGTWTKGFSASVYEFNASGVQISGSVVTGINRFATVAASASAAKWVAVAQAGEVWHLIAAECG